jgi:Tfp pilus assembly protein PilN
MIAINFSTRNYRVISRIKAGLATGSIVLCGVLAVMLWSAVSLRTGIAEMDRTLKELEAADEQVKPVLVERDRLVKDLSAMSGLMESRKFSWTRLLTNIEMVVPVGVALKKVEFNAKEHTLMLDGMAQAPESLRNLVVGMEKSAAFKDPLLKHQSLEKGSISFNVVAVYREYKGAGVAQGSR